MSFSSKNVRNFVELPQIKNEESNIAFQRKMKKQITVQNNNNQEKIYKNLNEGCVLNFIRNTERKESFKTIFSDSSEIKYDLSMVNKFEEKLNGSLSFISEFDLEEDDNKKNNDSFISSDNDNNVEEIIILNKNSKKLLFDKDEEEFNTQLEKEWENIKELALNKKAS